MPYVLEYTSLHYQRRRARRIAALSVLAAAVILGSLAWRHLSGLAARPTFYQIVHSGCTVDGVKIAKYSELSKKAFLLQSRFEDAAARQVELMPYLRLVWSQVPVTNVVAAVSEALASCDIPLLDPVGFTVAAEEVPPDRVRAHWTGPDSAFVEDLVATVRWRTVAQYDDRIISETGRALSNLFVRAKAPGVSNACTIVRIAIPDGRTEGLDVVSVYRFPTVPRLPMSKALDQTVADLRAFSKEASELEIVSREGSFFRRLFLRIFVGKTEKVGARPSLQAIYDAKAINLRKEWSVPFSESMDPGAWIVDAKFPLLDETQKRILEEWTARTQARAPWRRGFQRSLMGSSHFVSPKSLDALLKALPQPSEVDDVRKSLGKKAVGLTNALENVRLSEFDANPFDPIEPHATSNLLVVARGSVLIPTNGILGDAFADAGSLVLRHPRNTGVFPGVDVGGDGQRCGFARWTFDFAASDGLAAPSLDSLVSGLSAFAACGQGYAPRSVEVTLGKGRSAARVAVEGLLPFRFRSPSKEP